MIVITLFTIFCTNLLLLLYIQDPDTRYTYCQDYLHSMTVVPVNVEALKKQEAMESQARWKTEDGWIFPGMHTALENNQNPKQPHPSRIDELNDVSCAMFEYQISRMNTL